MFDTLKYTNGAIEHGYTRKQAEYQAEQMKEMVENDLVTKTFLITELKSLEVTLIKWMIATGFSVCGLILGVIKFSGKI